MKKKILAAAAAVAFLAAMLAKPTPIGATPPASPPPFVPAPGQIASGWQTLHSANDAVTLILNNNTISSCNVDLEGNLASTFSVVVETSQDQQHWFSAVNTIPSGAALSANGQIQVNPASFRAIRARLVSGNSGYGFALITCGSAVAVAGGSGGGAVDSVTAGSTGNLIISPTTGDVVVDTALDPTFTNIELTDLSSGFACYDGGKSFNNDCDTYDLSAQGVTVGSDGLVIPSLASAPCLGTNSSGKAVSAACPSPGPFNAGTCIGIVASPSPATINYTCATPTPEPSPIAGAGIAITGSSAPYTIAATGATPAPLAATSPLVLATPGGVDTFSCPTCVTANRAKLAIALGFATGVVSGSTIYPFQQVVGYSSGEITELRAACSAGGTSTTTFEATDVTSSTNIGTVSLSSSQTSNSATLGSPYSLTAGHVLTMTVTVAGGHSNCSLIAEGQQDLF